MASDKGPVATEAPPLTTPTALPAPALPTLPAADPVAVEPARAKSLKRSRETPPASPPPAAGTVPSNLLGSPPKAARLAISGIRRSPTPLTGAAALEDERRRREEEQRLHPPGSSENPGQHVLTALISGVAAMSRPTDAPDAAAPTAPTAPMDVVAKAPQPVLVPAGAPAPGDKLETSPQSATSPTSLSGEHVTESPTPMDVDLRPDSSATASHGAALQENRSNPGSLSYPGPLHAAAAMMPAPPQRGLSFPSPGHDSPNQTPGKKHKCPFCETEFTRHHNLKSHLLTHSQEKPYVCQECQMRFRRLHDLKRHSKLHTGEKNHICPKCDRKFARGDALARHSKGAGGCAGRRSSMGSFADGDDLEGGSMVEGDESMAGVVYGHDDDLTEEERRRLSLPSIKAQHVGAAQTAADALSGAHSRTYPPAAAGARERAATGGLYPPIVDRVTAGSNTSSSIPNSLGGGHTPNTSISSLPMSAGSSSLFSQSGMTESPKPLSPAGVQPNRRQSDRRSPPGYAASSTSQATIVGGAHGRAAAGQQAAGSGDSSSNMFASVDPGVWAYIQALEEKVKLLSERVMAIEKSESTKQAQIGLLTSELGTLKQQLDERDVAKA